MSPVASVTAPDASQRRVMVRRPPPVSTTSRSGAQTLPPRNPGEAPRTVAAHLGDPTVGVVQRHRRVGTVRPGASRISPSAPIPVSRSHSATASGRGERIEADRGSRCRCRGAWRDASVDPHHATSSIERPGAFGRNVEPPDPWVAPEPARWRRANARVRRTVSAATASMSGSDAVEMLDDLPVADRLASGSGPRLGQEGPYLVEEPGGQHRLAPAPRCAARVPRSARRTRACARGRPARAPRSDPHRTTRTADP